MRRRWETRSGRFGCSVEEGTRWRWRCSARRRSPRSAERGGRAASGAMDVGEFLTKGPGALMPRKRGGNERMDGERRKRQAGQNGRDSVEWKSEAEMVLRQQFD